MRSVSGETGSELSWEDVEILLSEWESFSLGELTKSGAEFECWEGELCSDEGEGVGELMVGILIILLGG
jgi:hypothetical protein